MANMREMLDGVRTIAVVGFSEDADKAAHYVPQYLHSHGFRIIPVNPKVAEAWGERGYALLREINDPVDLVLVFRRAEFTPDVVRDALAMPHRPRVIWLQSGIVNNEAKQLAEEAGITFVQDRCMMVEYKRLAA